MIGNPNSFARGASSALTQAQLSAAAMGHSKMGTGHLLIGLCRTKDELTMCILGATTPQEVEQAVFARYGRGEVGFSRVTGLTAHAQRALLRALAYANPEKNTLAGVAHIWQELLYEQGCTAIAVLESLGKSVEGMRTQMKNAVGEIERPQRAAQIPAADEPIPIAVVTAVPKREGVQGEEKKSLLDTYARNLTQAAKDGTLDPLIGREEEMQSLVRVLGKKTKNNPLLVGEPGVGKSALAEGLAQRIAQGSVPPMLRDAQVYALDLTQLIAGSKYRGEFEDRIQKLLAQVRERGDVILFIDEMHTLIGTGGSEGSLDASNILKPALARGEVRVIGATTYKEYQKYIEKDAALARRFQRIDVREPDSDQTLRILEGLRGRFEAFHQIAIADDALSSAVSLSARYVTDRFMPDKAIDLIDEAASMARIESSVGGQEGEETVIHADQIARVVAQWTGVPYEQVRGGDQGSANDLEERLSRRIIGQQEAVSAVSRALRRAYAGLNDPARPLGVFLLLGPSGVGKTELCKALSESLFGSEDALVRIDMSEYSEEATVSRLIGSPPGYVGHGEGGQLTDAVIKRPYSVVLFDEIEKAHPKVFSLLLQLLDDGHLTDSVGRKVNFKNTVVVMTSNAGVSFDMDKRMGFSGDQAADLGEQRKKTIMEQVKRVFRPEFMGRIDETVIMNTLNARDGEGIAALLLGKVAQRLGGRGILLTYDDEVLSLLSSRGVDAMSGARGLRRLIQREIEDPVSDLILSGEAGDRIHLTVCDSEIRLTAQQQMLLPV